MGGVPLIYPNSTNLNPYSRTTGYESEVASGIATVNDANRHLVHRATQFIGKPCLHLLRTKPTDNEVLRAKWNEKISRRDTITDRGASDGGQCQRALLTHIVPTYSTTAWPASAVRNGEFPANFSPQNCSFPSRIALPGRSSDGRSGRLGLPCSWS